MKRTSIVDGWSIILSYFSDYWYESTVITNSNVKYNFVRIIIIIFDYSSETFLLSSAFWQIFKKIFQIILVSITKFIDLSLISLVNKYSSWSNKEFLQNYFDDIHKSTIDSRSSHWRTGRIPLFSKILIALLIQKLSAKNHWILFKLMNHKRII